MQGNDAVMTTEEKKISDIILKIKNFSEELLSYKDKNNLDIPGTERNTSDGNVMYDLNSQS